MPEDDDKLPRKPPGNDPATLIPTPPPGEKLEEGNKPGDLKKGK